MKEQDIKGIRREGYSEARWILMDYGDVVAHVFDPEDRAFYGLEEFWEREKPLIAAIDEREKWSGVTGADGVAIAPGSPRNPRKMDQLEFIVVAEKDGDIAYLGSNWHEGIEPWDFGYGFNLYEKMPILRGSIFSDRGVYRLGEEIHFKAILRSDTPSGVKLLPAGTGVELSLRDSQDKEIDKRAITVNEWSSAEWTFSEFP